MPYNYKMVIQKKKHIILHITKTILRRTLPYVLITFFAMLRPFIGLLSFVLINNLLEDKM